MEEKSVGADEYFEQREAVAFSRWHLVEGSTDDGVTEERLASELRLPGPGSRQRPWRALSPWSTALATLLRGVVLPQIPGLQERFE